MQVSGPHTQGGSRPKKREKWRENDFYLANNFWLCSQQKVQDMMCINWALKSWLQDLTKIDKMQMKSFLFPSKSRPRHGKKIGNWHVIYVYVLTILKIEKKKRLHMVWPCLAVQDKEKGEGNNKFSLHFLTLAKQLNQNHLYYTWFYKYHKTRFERQINAKLIFASKIPKRKAKTKMIFPPKAISRPKTKEKEREKQTLHQS